MNAAILASVSVLMAGASFPGEADGRAPIEIEACLVRLTDAGRTATFQGTAIYDLQTSATGEIASVRPTRLPAFPKGVDLPGAEACIRRWRLEASTSYVLTFTFGTSGPSLKSWSMQLSGGSRGVLKIVLPRGDGSPKAP